MKRIILLASGAAIMLIASSVQAAIIWTGSVTLGTEADPRTTSWGAFGMVQNQGSGSNATLGHTFFIDNASYTSNLGQESQTFDTSALATAAGWTEQESRDGTNEFGFSNTINAFGPNGWAGNAGEGGGFLARIGGNPGGDGNQGMYADVFSSGVSMTSNMLASGRMNLNTTAADGSFYLGWLNPTVPNNNDHILGFTISEPVSGELPAGEARIRVGEVSTGFAMTSATASTSTFSPGLLLNHPGAYVRYTIDWNATTRSLTGTIETIEVPEPASLSLGALTLAGIVGVARKRSR